VKSSVRDADRARTAKGQEDGQMKVECLSCRYEINLDHKVFDDYSGQIRCYSCGAMMEVKTKKGVMFSLIPLESCPLQISDEGRSAATF